MTQGLFSGAELAQAWQKGLEAWWQALLLDPRRLRELAAQLQPLAAAGAAGPRDLGRLLEALEILERRVGELEGQVRGLAEGLGGVLALVTAERPGRPAPAARRAAQKAGTRKRGAR
jgi:hypothetical protein